MRSTMDDIDVSGDEGKRMEETMTTESEETRSVGNGIAAGVIGTRTGAGVTRDQQPTLVLGGTGKTGRRVAERLSARGVPVRIGSRSGEPPFDWEDRDTWALALRDVESIYVSYY